jgi:hypothetical protein
MVGFKEAVKTAKKISRPFRDTGLKHGVNEIQMRLPCPSVQRSLHFSRETASIVEHAE